MRKLAILLISLVYITMMSCNNNQAEHEHSHESEEHNHESELSHNNEDTHDHDHSVEENQNLEEEHDHKTEESEEHQHDYKTAKVAFEPFHSIIKTSGELKLSTSGEFVLTAPSAGIVYYADQSLSEGTSLKAGQNLFYISGEDLVDNNVNIRYNQVKSTYDKAKSDYERAEQLVKQNIISEKEFDQAKMVYLNAKSEFDIMKKSASGKSSVKTPSKSFIKEFYVEEGQYVEAGEKLACIINHQKLRLVAEVSQKHFQKLSDIESATFIPAGSKKAFDTHELNGKLLAYGKAINTESYYLPIVFEIDYHKELVPGSFAQIFLKGKQSSEKQVIVPKTALIEEQGNYFIFVEEGHDQFHKHPVTLGDDDGEQAVILDGLKGNETIVTEGTYFVKLASMSSALPAHSHSH
ncbi:MAG: efflux RND transporter periplasmic adaptor subunit [Bacteroidetes bacterium]|nr:efflux RND transporter periplasmic adaptor subunit [Bacteroidota bacterium]